MTTVKDIKAVIQRVTEILNDASVSESWKKEYERLQKELGELVRDDVNSRGCGFWAVDLAASCRILPDDYQILSITEESFIKLREHVSKLEAE